MLSAPVDSSLAMQTLSGQEMAQRKLQIDALQKRLENGADEKQRLREACQGFEAVFLNKMWEQMRKNVSKEGYLHSKDEETYQAMFDQEFSKKMAEAGGIGLGDMLYEQLSQRLSESTRTQSPSVSPNSPIIPAGSSPSSAQLGPKRKELNPLHADKAAMQLNPEKELNFNTGNPFAPQAAPAKAMDFESISQSLLQAELVGQEGSPDVRQNSGSDLSADEASTLQAALGVAMQEATIVPGEFARVVEKGEASDNKLIASRTMPEFAMPVEGDVITPFGRVTDLQGNTSWHQGVDIGVSESTPVRAGLGGKVAFAGKHPEYGNLVILEHEGGWRSFYGNAQSLGRKVGDSVASGTEFARVTAPKEESAAPHLHFEIRRGELAVNPEGESRLLAAR